MALEGFYATGATRQTAPAVHIRGFKHLACLDATHGPGAGDPYSAAPPARPFLEEAGADPGRFRIAFTRRAPNGAEVGADALRVLEETASLAAELGHRVEEADPVLYTPEMPKTSLPMAEMPMRRVKKRDRPMERVVQQDRYGCGIACVAMLAGESYRAVREEMFPSRTVSNTNTGDLRRVLAVYGLKLAHHLVPFRSTAYEDLTDNSILKVNPRRGGAEWHWVVWDAERRRLLDPKDPPYQRFRAISYLKVR